MSEVSLRDYIDSRFVAMEDQVEGLSILMRRELDLLSEDRERQRHDLADRLEGMNELRAQLDKQATTFATRDRLDSLEKTTWRALGILGGVVLLVQTLAAILFWVT